jgi:hypothetical protein
MSRVVKPPASQGAKAGPSRRDAPLPQFVPPQGRKVHEFVSGDGRTTFIHQIMAQTSPRRIVSRFFGRDRVGNTSTATPVEKPTYGGRMSLRGGLPRSA